MVKHHKSKGNSANQRKGRTAGSKESGLDFRICETTPIKEVVLRYPEAIKVLAGRGVPVSCAQGTIAEAARACGLSPALLLTDLLLAMDEDMTSGSSANSGRLE